MPGFKSKLVQDNCQKGRVVCVTERKQSTFWQRFVSTWGDFPIFYVSVHCSHTLIFKVSSKSVRVWGSYNRDPQSDFNIGSYQSANFINGRQPRTICLPKQYRKSLVICLHRRKHQNIRQNEQQLVNSAIQRKQ